MHCRLVAALTKLKALCFARQHHYNYREVIDVISGIVFLGTPHISVGRSDDDDVLSDILRSRPKSQFKSEAVTRDQEDLQVLCQQFELAKLQVRVLSAYEGCETKLTRRPLIGFWKKRSGIVSSLLV